MVIERVQCPACGALLGTTPECFDKPVRCGRCQHRFRLSARPIRAAVPDETIASWLTAEQAAEMAEAAPSQPTHPQEDETPSGGTAVLPALGDGLRLVRIDHGGALFEFPSSCLMSEAFRCSMPRRCLGCSARAHLRAHVIIFATELTDSISLEAEHSAGALVLSEAEVRDLSGRELLGRLGGMPNVPAPGNLPMPYWLCDMCSGAGAISGQIKIHSGTGEGLCRLRLRNLRRAEEFLIAVGKEDTPCHETLLEKINATAEKPWDQLPDVVQHRIQQWFRPDGDERFLTYIPDRDHARTEDGMAGLVISSRRLIYHTDMRHREADVAQPVELTLATSAGKEALRIKTPAWQVKRMPLDRRGESRLRRGLAMANCRAIWR